MAQPRRDARSPGPAGGRPAARYALTGPGRANAAALAAALRLPVNPEGPALGI